MVAFGSSEESQVTDKDHGAAGAALQAIARREAELKRREDAVASTEAAFAEVVRKERRRENEAFLGDLVGAGKLAPGLKPKVLAFMDHLGSETVEFAEGGTKVANTALDYFRGILIDLPKAIEFSEVSKGSGGGDPSAGLTAAAREYQTRMAAQGVRVSAAEAVRAAQRG